MRFSTIHKGLAKCAAKAAGRYAMADLRLETTPPAGHTSGGSLVATDGRRIVVVPVELDDGDDAGLVSVEAFTQAVKLAGKGSEASMKANGSLVCKNGATFERPTGDFPRWQQAMPAFRPADPGTVTIAFNAVYLAEIIKALGTVTDCASITFQVETDSTTGRHTAAKAPILVGTGSKAFAFGALMPITTEG